MRYEEKIFKACEIFRPKKRNAVYDFLEHVEEHVEILCYWDRRSFFDWNFVRLNRTLNNEILDPDGTIRLGLKDMIAPKKEFYWE